MSTGTLRKQSGFLDTSVRVREARRASPGPMRRLLSEAGEMIRGVFEAPLRHAERVAAARGLEHLDPNLRKDIGVDA